MAKKEFKAESKRLLELMIHSIYTNKEIFLRELISNASDATDKRYYENAQDGGEALNRNDLPITLSIDVENRQLTIEDNGCGMTGKELEENIGTIAKSGSLDFKKNMEENEDVDIIGQFGVGFYSAFMVADKVEVYTKSPKEDTGWHWVSQGVEGYTMSEFDKPEQGSKIVLTIKENTDDEHYDMFLDGHQVERLVKKHSDYIRYPIRMEVEKFRTVEKEEGEDETESYKELETLNSMVPLWRRRKGEVSDEDYNNFYREKFGYQDPLRTIYTSTEGLVAYDALMFIPANTPYNYYSKDFEKGLELYASAVLIVEKCSQLLPDYFGFVQGVVDSQDLSLNISREMLQEDRQLRVIGNHLEKKIQAELLDMQTDDREAYNEFFANFGDSIKYGIYESFGSKNEFLQDLLVFHNAEGNMVTLKEYTDSMPEEQKYIYYASGADLKQLKNLPAGDSVLDKGFDIIYLTHQIDEFTIRMMNQYADKEFRSIVGDDLGLESEEDKQQLEEKSQEHEELLDFMASALGDEVSDVQLSSRLVNDPVVLTTKGEITLEMERVLKAMPGDMPIAAERVLEVNPNHPIFEKLVKLYSDDQDLLKAYTNILYNNALMLEGMQIDDPKAYTKQVTDLLI